MAICRHCNAEVSDGATFCPVCGKPVMKKEKVVLCPECGLENPVGTAFCVHCGSKLPGEKNPNLESESVQKLKGLLPVIKGIASTFDDPYAGASQEEIEKMTYVCPVCGKRNRNNEEKCARCGRDRKRTAALAAKNAFRASRTQWKFLTKNIVRNRKSKKSFPHRWRKSLQR